MNQVMKIGKGVEKIDGETVAKKGYVSKCATSLTLLLKESQTVTLKAMGVAAIANTMKAIARADKILAEDDKHIKKVSVPTFVTETVDDMELAIFTIDVSTK